MVAELTPSPPALSLLLVAECHVKFEMESIAETGFYLFVVFVCLEDRDGFSEVAREIKYLQVPVINLIDFIKTETRLIKKNKSKLKKYKNIR